MKGPLGQSLEDRIDRPVERRPARDQRQRIEIALHRHARLHMIAHESEIDRPVEAHRIDRNLLHVAQQGGADPARKSDHLRVRHLRAHLRDDLLRRRDAPAAKFLRRQNPGPGIEDLHRIDPGLQLPDQIARRRIDQYIDQPCKASAIAIGEQPRRRLIRRAVPRDHVGRDRPWRSAKSQQRHTVRKTRPSPARSFRRPAPACRDRARGLSRAKPARSAIGSSCGPSPAANLTCCPSACGITRISENRIAASNPKRRTGCSVTSAASSGREAELEKISGLFAQLPDIRADNGRLAASARPEAGYADRRSSTSRRGLFTA